MKNTKQKEEMLAATELGNIFGVSGIRMNRFIAKCGLQEKVSGKWKPTKLGKRFASKHACIRSALPLRRHPNDPSKHIWGKGARAGRNYKWNVDVISDKWEKFHC